MTLEQYKRFKATFIIFNNTYQKHKSRYTKHEKKRIDKLINKLEKILFKI